MNARTVRMKKEARALFWPWCAVTIAGALPLVPHASDFSLVGIPIGELIILLGFFIGIPFLATLAFGNEFQHRTLSLLLSQPAGRIEIWREKLMVTAFAVVSAALVFWFSWRTVLTQEQLVVAGLYIITVTVSATFWTLVARSTIGGLALGGLALGGLEIGGFILEMFLPGLVIDTAERLLGGKLPPREAITILSALSVAALGYAGLMLWLGARKLARFQVTGGVAGDDLLMAGPKLMPEALAEWFRHRPTQPIFNLIRKELRLLQPLWLMALLIVVYMTFLAALGLFPEPGQRAPRGQVPAQVALFIPVVAFIPLMAILAGCLSLGEERTSGTHSWHMTLPVPARRQWLIKLLVALSAGLFCAALLPILVLLAYGFIFGSPFRFLEPRAAVVWMILVPLLSLFSFWCACAVSGTVRAALWVFPLMGTLLVAGRYGDRVAGELMDFLASRFDLFAHFGFTNVVSNIQLYDRDATPMLVATLFLLPTVLFAVIQSYRLFRTQLQDSTLSVIRSLLPLAMVAFLWTFSLGAFDAFVNHAKRQMWTLFHETHEAIEKIQPGTAKLESAGPLQLRVEDLAKASPLSERTRRWLGNSSITVAPDKPHSGPYCCGANSRGISVVPDKTYSWYLATIHRPGGSVCTVSFQAGRGYGILGGVCE